jgi:hypothetical protein
MPRAARHEAPAKVPASRAGGTAVLREAAPKGPAAGRDGDRRAGLTEAEVLAEPAAAEEPTDTAAITCWRQNGAGRRGLLLPTRWLPQPPNLLVVAAVHRSNAMQSSRAPQHFPSPSIH